MRSILLYLLLVGMPVLGLLALLHIGQGLTPPISVAGTWTVQTTPQLVDAPSCSDPFGRSGHPRLTITQSGSRLLLMLNDDKESALTGEINGPNINAEVVSRPPAAAVNLSLRDAPEILFRASVDRRALVERLVGELSFINRPFCARIPFTATRDSKLRRIEGQ
jgi:hypothetical protein